MSKIALVTGVSGQDGYYISHLLLSKGYKIYGADINEPIDIPNLHFYHIDISEVKELVKIIKKIDVDEIYNFGAISDIDTCECNSKNVYEYNSEPVLKILEYIRYNKNIKFFQAGSSEIYRKMQYGTRKIYIDDVPDPYSEYAKSKFLSHLYVNYFRNKYDIYAIDGIFFNHSSPRQTNKFAIPSICEKIYNLYREKLKPPIYIKNINSMRDWGHAEDYMKCAWLSMQEKHPRDYLIGTGKLISIYAVCLYVFYYFFEQEKKINDFIKYNVNFYEEKENIFADILDIRSILGCVFYRNFQNIIQEILVYKVKNYENA